MQYRGEEGSIDHHAVTIGIDTVRCVSGPGLRVSIQSAPTRCDAMTKTGTMQADPPTMHIEPHTQWL